MPTIKTLLRKSLFFCAALATCLPLGAQISIPSIGSTPAAPVVAEKSLDQQREQAKTEVETVRNQLKEANSASTVDLAAQADKEERQRLLDLLLYFKNEKLWRLDEQVALEKSKPPPLENQPLVQALGNKPPYSVLRLDALRDELDAKKDRLQWLQSVLHAWEGEKQTLTERLRKYGEASRRASEKAAQEGTDAARRRQELADLYRQMGEAELSARVVDQDYQRAQIAVLKPQIKELEKFLADVLPGQRLSDEDMAEQRKELRAARSALIKDMDLVTARHTRFLSERQQLIAAAAQGETPQRLTFVDQALRADSTSLDGLRVLQLLEQARNDAWEARFALLGKESDPAEKQRSIDALQKIAISLNSEDNSWRRVLAVQDTGLRAAISEQEAHIARQVPNSSEVNQEREILSLQRDALATFERVNTLAVRMNREAKRWLGDFGATVDPSVLTSGNAWQLVKRSAGAVWNYELFSVEDSSQVDGQTVTVSYGVTVGKSIGAIVVFFVGYWLFSLLTQRAFRILIGMGAISAELASVLRRWLMITVAVVLVILVLNLAHIPLTVFAFVGGALAIGVGFGTQTIIKNFISGIILLFERKVRVGDIVVVGGITGTVSSVDLRATTVKAFDGVEALIPNSNVLENQVVNWTYSNRRLRREIKVQVEYGSPVREATRIVLSCAEEHGQILDDPAPEVYFDDFADSGLNIGLLYWIELGPNIGGRRIDSDLRFMIEKRLTSAGIGFPFPTRDVNLRVSQPLPVSVVPPVEADAAAVVENQGEENAAIEAGDAADKD